mmetsp:Transcript_5117/g.14007  ORF Transcript_5117/g.14007 Transcript_5117/m.14007 type:complete len:92 (-) Transcript_5117:71-346(-)
MDDCRLHGMTQHTTPHHITQRHTTPAVVHTNTPRAALTGWLDGWMDGQRQTSPRTSPRGAGEMKERLIDLLSSMCLIDGWMAFALRCVPVM